MVEQWVENNKQKIRCAVVTMIALAGFMYGVCRVYHMDNLGRMKSTMVFLYIATGIFGLAYVVILQILIYYKKVKLERLFIVSTVILATGYMLFFAPIKVPDEQLHYISAYRMSNFLMLHWEQASTEGILMRNCDADFYATHAPYGIMTGDSYSSLLEEFSLIAQDTSTVSYETRYVSGIPWQYLAAAIGIMVGRLFHLGAVPVFYMGRLFNIAQYIILVFIAMKRAPMIKECLFVVSMFPMTLHLIASYSYDGVCIGISILFISELIQMIYGETIRRKQIIYCTILGMLLAPTKLVYTPLLFLIFLIPNQKLKGVCKHPWLLKEGMIAAGIFALVLMQMTTVIGYAGEEAGGSYIAWAQEEGYTLAWSMEHLLDTIRIYCYTFLNKTDYYISTMFGSSLGWFQFDVPMFLYLPFGILFLLMCMKKEGEKKALTYGAKCWIFVLVVISNILIYTSMYLSWTPISSPIILGIQGRYFLPLLPAVYLLARNNSITITKAISQHIVIMTAMLNIFVLLYCSLGFLSSI